jgi:SAM-dependent methyltransferase
MHWSSYKIMEEQLKKYLGPRFGEHMTVVDVGSQVIGKQPLSYRSLMPPAWRYVGVDLGEGKNVDQVMPSEYEIPMATGEVNVVISGQCLEHCRNPFRLMGEITRILRPHGLALVTAPAVWPEHKCPLDCFRFYPDGMRSVMEEAGLSVEDAFIGWAKTNVGGENPVAHDCWGIGRKP